jgi:outer membrane protein assembly factor BamB
MFRRSPHTTIILILTLAAGQARGNDWPQFLGPLRSGVSTEHVATKWPASGLPQRWKRPVGAGFSGPVVAGGRVILFHRKGTDEVVDCMESESGKLLWTKRYPTTYRDDFGFSNGPRATPTLAEGKVLTFGAAGVLSCWELSSGALAWRNDTVESFGARKGFFGFACSPLVEAKKVLLNVGGLKDSGIVAFDLETGAVAWRATDHEASYSSPVAATMNGERHVFFFTRAGLVDLDAIRGKVRFEFPWRARMSASVNAATPLVVGDRVFVSASYRTGAALLRVSGEQYELVWSSRDTLSNHYATSVVKEGHIYGFDGRQEHGPQLSAITLEQGKAVWTHTGLGAGTLMLVKDGLLILTEDGKLVLADASPKEYKERARATLLPGVVRAYPALSNGLFYARNESTLVCVDVRP